MDPKNRQELHGLLSALLDGALEPGQESRLGGLLRQDPEARDLYLAYFGLHADLALRGEQREGAPPARSASTEAAHGVPIEVEPAKLDPDRASSARGTSLPPFGASRRTRYLAAGALGLAGLAAGLLLVLSPSWKRPQNISPPSNQGAEPIDHTVAVLLQAPGAEWEETDLPARVGAPLPPGWLRLKAGFAHIEFYNGAMVILEGPAEFQLISRTEAYCARGKLRATVPPQAQGFTIGSPKMDLVDRGTEFGLQVSAGGKTEVHVFQGKVELYNPGSSRETPSPRKLTTGQGGRLDDSGAVRPIALNADAFLTAQKLADRSRAETLRRQQNWLATSEALRRDPHLLVYYPFQAEQSWSRTLLDQAAGRRQPRDGAIVGCSWVTGRWPGKQGLEFKRVSDRVRLHVPGTFDALTLMAWVRVDALPNVNNSLFMTDGWPEGAPHWQIGNNGTLILGVRAPAKTRNPHYHAPNVLQPERLGQWLHLAVVYDRDGGLVTHYVDGRPVAQEAMVVNIPLRIGDAEIGNWNVAAGRASQPIRYFSGCMDEFMLFDRALSAREVEQLYNQGRPAF
jgi:hypothetical protein